MEDDVPSKLYLGDEEYGNENHDNDDEIEDDVPSKV